MEQAVGQLFELDVPTTLQRLLSAPCKYGLLITCGLPLVAYAADYSSPYGQWHGQAQFHARIGGETDQSAHSVSIVTISVDPQGKLVSTAASNGCRALGLVAPGVSPRIFYVDVTLSGCTYAGLNRRYSGQLALYPQGMYASFSLQTSVIGLAKKPISYDVRATLRR